MNKQEFISILQAKLSGMPKREVKERLSFYEEIINDKIEEGLSEEQAILELGSIEKIANQIASDIPLKSIVKEKIKPKRALSGFEITLLVLGSPIWLSLLIAAFVVAIGLVSVVFALWVSVWAIFLTFSVCSVAGLIIFTILLATGKAAVGFCILGFAITLAGLSILSFYGGIYTTKGLCYSVKTLFIAIKKCFVNKEAKL